MTVRHVVYALLAARVSLAAIVGNRIYDANALGTPTGKEIPQKPFIVMSYGEDTGGPREDATVEDRLVDVYAYQDPGDFTLVEYALREVKGALHRASGLFGEGENKTWLTSASYVSGSRDLYDDIYRANCRYATYRLIGNTP